MEEGDEEDEDSWWEDSWEGYQLEAYPAASYDDDDDDDDPELVPDEDQDYEEYELDEPEAIALNSIEELDDTADAGHAIQLQLAANAAFGKAKGKGKGKGKVVRSHLTLEQRRDKLKALKAKSKCLRCGGTGHWAGDPECKFPNGNGGGGGKPRAHVAIIQGSSADGLHVAAAAGSHTSFMVNERQPLPPHPGQGPGRPKSAPMAASSRPSGARGSTDVTRPMEMAGGDRKFYIGQFKGKTYHELAQNISHIQDFLTWFDRYYVITGGAVELRSSLGIPEGTYQPRTKPTGGKKVPPNPPLEQKCRECKDFSYAGSSTNYAQKTCRDCGHKTKEKRELTLTHDPATCPHSIVDHRGSSRSTHRTFCKQCGTFIDEVPGDFHKERRNAAEQVLNATAEASGTVQALTSEDATTCLDATLVEGIVGVFADRVSTMAAIEQAISPQTLHDVLRDCIIEITDDPESPWSQVNAGEPSPVAMMGLIQPNYGVRFAQCPRSITWYNLTSSLLHRHRQEVFDDLRALLRPRTS